ncbi:MAG: hypothetical protein RIR26_375 [Pseudomonadota bacterium]|jgi:hypothetical protein
MVVFFRLIFLSLGLLLSGCVQRSYNDEEAAAQNIFAFNRQRIAFDYVGFGWCYFLEDTIYKPQTVKTNIVDSESNVDLDTGIERTDKYQVVFTLRKFDKQHPTPFEFNAFSAWTNDYSKNGTINTEEFTAAGQVESSIQALRSDISRLSSEKAICEDVKKGLAPKINYFPVSDKQALVSEYRLRCRNDSTEVSRRAEVEMLSQFGYEFARKGLDELVKNPKWQQYLHLGTPCPDSTFVMEISRGQYLGSESKKVF